MNNESLVIIGSGPAALTAAIYAARANLNPLIIEGEKPGGQLMSTTYVENWPGTRSILGPKLMMDMLSQARDFGTRFLSENVTQATLTNQPFTLTTHKNTVITAQALIIATGAQPRMLGCPGEQAYWAKGVTTCAVCDGAFYKDKKIVVVGGGDSAMESASLMTNFTKDITVIQNLDALTASVPMQARALNNPAIKIIYSSTVKEIKGDGMRMTGVSVYNQATQATTELEAEALFLAIGLIPTTALFKGQIDLTPAGYIAYKQHTQTSIEGVFAAGDVADARYRQAITSSASGCMAALDAEHYLKEQGLKK